MITLKICARCLKTTQSRQFFIFNQYNSVRNLFVLVHITGNKDTTDKLYIIEMMTIKKLPAQEMDNGMNIILVYFTLNLTYNLVITK